jgi:hypothetical protein
MKRKWNSLAGLHCVVWSGACFIACSVNTNTPNTGRAPLADTSTNAGNGAVTLNGAAGRSSLGTSGAPASIPSSPASAGSGALIPLQTAQPSAAAGLAAAGASAPAGMAGAPAAPPGPMPEPITANEDGDPNTPVFTNPDLKCRQGGGISVGLSQPNFKVDDRDVIIDYPCNKHAGAPMTFILNLHGTTPVEEHFYQEGYFSAWQFVSTHNLIIATPSSVVQQWGNGDNGQDEPYLMDVIAYVYKAFAAFNIKQMWVGGHSWGAMYTATFGCKPELADKVKGLIIMSGAPTLPSCSQSVSLLNTVAEMDIGPAIDFKTLPMQHGCGSVMSDMLGNNTETFWPACTAPFVHAKYLMLGKMHADFMDKEVVQSLVDWIKISRQMQP